MTGWNVHLDGEEIDCVFYDDCYADYVRRGLIEHDGYDPRIVVRNSKEYRQQDDLTVQ